MKILLYSHFYYPEIGAASVRMQYFVNSLKEGGHEVKILSPFPNYPQGKIYDGYEKNSNNNNSNGVVHAPIYLPKKRSVTGRLLSYISYFISSFIYALRMNYRPDVIIASTPPIFTALAACIFARVKKINFVLDARDIWPDIGIELGILKNKQIIWMLRKIENYLLKSAKFITVTAESDKRNLLKKNVSPDKIHVIYNGADTSKFLPSFNSNREKIKTEFNLPADKKLVIFFGSFNDGMNDIATLGKALSKLSGLNNTHFVFAGDGKNRNKFLDTIDGKINYTYFGILESDKIAKLLAASDLSIVPIKHTEKRVSGNIPVKCFESWSSGVPVLLSVEKDSEIASIIGNNDAGILIEPNDADNMSNVIAGLLNGNHLLEMGKRGREFMENKFDRKVQANKLNDYLNILQ